jgi:hypothetical protein
MTIGEIIQIKSKAYPMHRRIVSITRPSGWLSGGGDPPTSFPEKGAKSANLLCCLLVFQQ